MHIEVPPGFGVRRESPLLDFPGDDASNIGARRSRRFNVQKAAQCQSQRTVIAAILFLFTLLTTNLQAQDWKSTLANTPFPKTTFQAHQLEPIELILNAFKPTNDLRAVVLMPAAADQLCFFNWGKLELPPNPSILDALNALNNKAQIRYTFVPPFLLLHLDRDTPSDPLILKPDATAKLATRIKRGKLQYLDRPYDKILPQLDWFAGLKSTPNATSSASYHFYRLSFVGYNLSAHDFLRAMAYGTKTTVTIDKRRALFQDRPFQKTDVQ